MYTMKEIAHVAGPQRLERSKMGGFWSRNVEAGTYLLLFNERDGGCSRTTKGGKVENGRVLDQKPILLVALPKARNRWTGRTCIVP